MTTETEIQTEIQDGETCAPPSAFEALEAAIAAVRPAADAAATAFAAHELGGPTPGLDRFVGLHRGRLVYIEVSTDEDEGDPADTVDPDLHDFESAVTLPAEAATAGGPGAAWRVRLAAATGMREQRQREAAEAYLRTTLEDLATRHGWTPPADWATRRLDGDPPSTVYIPSW